MKQSSNNDNDNSSKMSNRMDGKVEKEQVCFLNAMNRNDKNTENLFLYLVVYPTAESIQAVQQQ